MSVGLKGWGSYLPEHYFSINDERIGLLEQRLASTQVNTFDMAVNAAREAIEHSAVDVNSIKGVYLGTETPLYKVGSTSNQVAGELGLINASCLDVEFACAAGFLSLQKSIIELSSGFYDAGDAFLVLMSDKSLIDSSSVFYDLVGHAATAFVVGFDPLIEVLIDPSTNKSESLLDFYVTYEEPTKPVCDGSLSVHAYKRLVYSSVNEFLSNNDFGFNSIIGHIPVPRMIDWMTITDRQRESYANPFSSDPSLFQYCITQRVGNSFNANAGLNLINALEQSSGPVLGFSYGSGAIALTMGFKVKTFVKPVKSLQSKLSNGIKLKSKKGFL